MPPIVRVLRPHQWIKNLLLFLPLLLAHDIRNGRKWLLLVAATTAMCFTASAVYVLNDRLDVEADRSHPTKRARPFASGRLPLSIAPLIILILLGAAAGLSAAFLPHRFWVALACYFLVSTAYSLALKSRVLVDVMVLAGLYTLRVLAGGIAVAVPVSPWLLAFATFLFVSLAFVKRYTELRDVELRGNARAQGRGYDIHDLRIIEAVGPASGYMAVLVLALYISDAAALLYITPLFLWLICPLLMYWITRIWLIARRGGMHQDPILFAVRDRVSWYCLGLVCVLGVLATYYWPVEGILLRPVHPLLP